MSFAAPPQQGSSDYGWRPPTTFVDVLFLILAFFITIAAFKEDDRQVNVSLPTQEATTAGTSARTQIVVTVTADEKVYMGDRQYTIPELRRVLGELAKQYPDESVIVRADRSSSVGMFAKVVDTANAAGLHNLRFATTKPPAEVGK